MGVIDRQAAIDALHKWEMSYSWDEYCGESPEVYSPSGVIKALPSAEPESAIPLSWIETHIEWLKSLDNAFSTLTAIQISAMVNKWKDEQDGN